ncbi:hypothetical protein [Streptomyces fodineus]|uniref:hypothetical protein n=1 Tax=Streptomyces fodineus TaxID=1904616 RepID=UPI001D051609|nr:hypothetical protein [Streptomyces fodineus]
MPDVPIVAESLAQCLSEDDVSITTRISLAGALAMIVPGHKAATGLLRATATEYTRPAGFGTYPDAAEVRYQAAKHLAGLVTNLLNLKIALLYAALLPQFLNPQAGPAWKQLLQLGGVRSLWGSP